MTSFLCFMYVGTQIFFTFIVYYTCKLTHYGSTADAINKITKKS